LKITSENKGIKFIEKKRLKIKFKGKDIGVYEPDFIIEDKIIVEIKSVLTMPKIFEKQLYYYLKGSDCIIGYLVNFGSGKIDIKRRVYDAVRNIRENPR